MVRHTSITREGVNEDWTASISVVGPRLQLDYSVAFGRHAITDEQLYRFRLVIGRVFHISHFVAKYRTYSPSLACEVKCGAAALDVADRRNAHSLTIAVKGCR